MTVYLICGLILILYTVLIGAITLGWFSLPAFKSQAQPLVTVSVVVALRNEAERLPGLLRSLTLQQYPAGQMEILLVDDHSEDATAMLLDQYIAADTSGFRIRLVKLTQEQGYGKKSALNAGVSLAKGQLIITTDADCNAGDRWIFTLASFYETYKPQMIQAPVLLNNSGSLFGKLQTLEFASLIAATAGSCSMGFPLMANGANLAFTKQAFRQCNGYSQNQKIASGDDMFLMQQIIDKYGTDAVKFCRSSDALVITPVNKTLHDFLAQRKRWVSKSRTYKGFYLPAVSTLVLLANLMLLVTGGAACIVKEFQVIFAIVYGTKLLIDFPVMAGFSLFAGNRRLLWLFPVMELLNAFYTAYIAIAGTFGSFTWKGRIHRNGIVSRQLAKPMQSANRQDW